MVRQSIGHPARVQRLLQRIKHQRRLHATHHPPADDITAVHVDDEGGVNVAAARRHAGEVCHPQLVWPARAEVAFDQIRQVRTPFADGGALALAAPHALQARTAHQPLNRAVRHRDTFTQQLSPDLARAVDAIAPVAFDSTSRASR